MKVRAGAAPTEPGLLIPLDLDGQPKVSQLHCCVLAFACQEQVLWLEREDEEENRAYTTCSPSLREQDILSTDGHAEFCFVLTSKSTDKERVRQTKASRQRSVSMKQFIGCFLVAASCGRCRLWAPTVAQIMHPASLLSVRGGL